MPIELELPVNYRKLNQAQRKVVREKYISIQNGKCHYCKMPLSGKPKDSVLAKAIDESLFPPGFLKWPVHLHHDHETGMTIGAIHSYCNAVMWQYYGE